MMKIVFFKLLSILSVNLVFSPFLPAQGSGSVARNHAAVSRINEEIEIVQIAPLIVLKGQVNGQPANVLFDTGTWPNLIGSHMESQLGGTILNTKPSHGGYRYCESNNLVLGNLISSYDRKICIIDLAPMTEGLGIKIDAVIGTPFIVGRVVEFNFDDKKFRFCESPSSKFDSMFELEFDEFGRPLIEMEIGHSKDKFLIDTGYNGCILLTSSYYKLIENDIMTSNGRPSESIVFSAGFKKTPNKRIYAKRLTVFDNEFSEVPISVSNENDAVNTIGMEILRRFNVSFDLQQRKLRLSRNKAFGSEFEPEVSAKPK